MNASSSQQNVHGKYFLKPFSFPLETMYVSSNQFIAKIKLGFLEQKK